MQGDGHLLAAPLSTDGQDDLRFVLLCSQVTVVNSEGAFYETLRHRALHAAAAQGQGQVQMQGQGRADFMLTSAESDSGLLVGVVKTAGSKCNRCWYYSTSVGHGSVAGAEVDTAAWAGVDTGTGAQHDSVHSDLCLRCAAVLRTDKHPVA